MSRNLESARELVGSFEESFPAALRLALAVSMAVKVEPALLRKARLELEPDLDAGAESDLWFSALVGSASARALVFEPDVVAVLREELCRRCEREGKNLERYRAVVVELHTNEPEAIRLEERLVWLGLRGGDIEAEVEAEVLPALKTMVESSLDGGMEVARWADRALLYLPEAVRRTEAIGLLGAGAALRLGTSARLLQEGVGQSSTRIATGALWLQPRAERSSRIYSVLRYANALTFAEGKREGGAELPLLPGDDVAIDLFRLDATEETKLRSVALAPEVAVPLPDGDYDLLIKTASGQSFQLSAARPEDRTAPSTGRELEICFLLADTDGHRKAAWNSLAALRSAGHRVWEARDLVGWGGASTKTVPFGLMREFENRLRRSDLAIVYLGGDLPPDVEQSVLLEMKYRESEIPFALPVLVEQGATIPEPLADQELLETGQVEGVVAELSRSLPERAPLRSMLLAAAQKDSAFVETLAVGLGRVAGAEGLELWSAFNSLGVRGRSMEELERRTTTADFVLLFESRSFGHSPVNDVFEELAEMRRTMTASLARVVVERTADEGAWFLAHAALNDPDMPLDSLDEKEQAEAMVQISERVGAWVRGELADAHPTAETAQRPDLKSSS